MAQKTNPISFRLGSTRVWDSTLQVYGKSYSNYFLPLHSYLASKSYLQRHFSFNTFAPEIYELEFRKNAMLVNIRNSHLVNFSYCLPHKTSNKITDKFFAGTILFRFFPKAGELPDVVRLAHYARYLLEMNTPPKKVIWSLHHLVKLSTNLRKVFYYKFGLLNARLKGFKVQMSGRFSNSKNQMAQTIVYKVGLLPLTCIKSSVDYLNIKVHTKLGSCGLQIWLFYEIQN
nr:ribosomal protein S3 [Gloiopeltis furcata]